MAKTIHIHTDGSTRNNGFSNARSAYGVYCRKGHQISGQCNGPHNSGRSEAEAMNRGLAHASAESKGGSGQHSVMHTDSKYAIRSAQGQAHDENYDIHQSSAAHIANIRGMGNTVDIVHVSGHSGDPGNQQADSLARGALDG